MLQEDISKTNDNFERYKERISNFSGEFELGLFLYISSKSLVWIALFFILAFAAAKLAPKEMRAIVHLCLHRSIHLDERRPGAFEPFAWEFLRRVEAETWLRVHG